MKGLVCLLADRTEDFSRTVELELKEVSAPEVVDADGREFTLCGNKVSFNSQGREARIFFIKQ